MSLLSHDLRDAWRSLLRQPGFTILAVLILGLGIGSSTAVFTLVDSVLLRPLPWPDAERLAVVWEDSPYGEPENPVSPANLFAWRERARSFRGLAATTMNYPSNLTGAGDPTVIQTAFTSDDFFDVLGVRAAVGRTYTAGDAENDVAVLSWHFWQQRFGGDSSIVGRSIQLDGEPVLVAGVVPPEFRSLEAKPDAYLPLELSPDARGRFLRVIGRLAPGATIETAQAEMSAIAASLSDEFPEFNKDFGVRVVPIEEQLTGAVRPALLVLMGAVGLLLLIACANVANLFLGRAAARQREFAIRMSLGGTRWRLIRKTLTESIVLAGIAGVLGIAFAQIATSALVRMLPANLALPGLEEVAIDTRVAGFALAVAAVTGILFGIAPALFASAVALSKTLRESGRGTTGGRNRFRHALVVAEVALAVVLLVGAGLLGRSLKTLLDVDPGMRPEHVLTARLALSGPEYLEEEAVRSFLGELFARLGAYEDVRAAGGVLWLPLGGAKSASSFIIEGRPKPPAGEEPSADIRYIAGDYFEAMGIPRLRGRTFDARDGADAPATFVINEELARKYFPNEDPIGKRLAYWWGDMLSGEIVGIVGNVREVGLDQDPAPAIYRTTVQEPVGTLTLVVRTAGDPAALASTVGAIVRQIDPDQPLSEVRTMEEVVSRTVARPRLVLTLLGAFAGMALLLAGLGLYAIIAYAVAQRSQEIGVRVALGADRSDVLRLIIRHGMVLTGAGLAIGLAVALVATRAMESLLYGVSATDPLTMLGVAVFLLGIAVLASWLPARRATRLDPVVTLRNE